MLTKTSDGQVFEEWNFDRERRVAVSMNTLPHFSTSSLQIRQSDAWNSSSVEGLDSESRKK